MNDQLARELISSINAQNDLKEMELDFQASLERNKSILAIERRITELIRDSKNNPMARGKIEKLEKELEEIHMLDIASISETFKKYKTAKQVYHDKY